MPWNVATKYLFELLYQLIRILKFGHEIPVVVIITTCLYKLNSVLKLDHRIPIQVVPATCLYSKLDREILVQVVTPTCLCPETGPRTEFPTYRQTVTTDRYLVSNFHDTNKLLQETDMLWPSFAIQTSCYKNLNTYFVAKPQDTDNLLRQLE